MEVCTIGFTRKSAPEFFGLLREAGVRRLLDLRLNNTSQLAGFTKQSDLPFLLREICGAADEHEPLLAPTQAMLDDYKQRKGSWEEYEKRFMALLRERRVERALDRNTFRARTVLLCSEPTPERCHRRLVLEYLGGHWPDLQIVHL